MARRRRTNSVSEPEVVEETPVAEAAEEVVTEEVTVIEEPEIEEAAPVDVAKEEELPDFGEGPGAKLRLAFFKRARAFLDLFQQARHELTPENVHQLRVSSRRLDAALTLMRSLIGRGPTKKLRAQIKEIRSSLSPLRDLQQQLEWLGDEPLLDELLTARASKLPKHIIKASKALSKHKASRLEKRLEMIDALLAALLEEEGAEDGCREILSRQVWETLLYAMSRAEEVDPDISVSYHPLRLAMKAFRYQAEVYGDAGWPNPLDQNAGWAKVKEMHQSLGALQDLEVLCCHLDEFWAEVPPIRESQARVVNRLLKDRHQTLGRIHLHDVDWENLWEWPVVEVEELSDEE